MPEASRLAPAAPCPKSATHFGLNSVALASLIASFVLLRHIKADVQTRVLIVLFATALPVGFFDIVVLKVHRRASTGLDWDKPFTPDLGRILTKLLGLALTVGCIAFAYWVFPEYRGAWYDPYYHLLARFWAPLTTLAISYTWLVDGAMLQPRDAYWQLGRVVLFQFGDARRADVANHARGWLVKTFFLPLMIVYLHSSVNHVADTRLDGVLTSLSTYNYLYDAIFGIDLTFTVVGYCMSFRVSDSHLRTAEPTMFGWAVALFCYQPFFSLFERQYVTYDGMGFGKMLEDSPNVRIAWSALILASITIYVLATVAFGWRFSNLTHRGILTNGPYRFTKHPAYVSKNFSWWLTSVPFAVVGPPQEALRRSLLLFMINGVYFLRARTEERHLSRDPAYVAYAEWINEHGVFAFLGRWLPFLRYRAPVVPVPIVDEELDALVAKPSAVTTHAQPSARVVATEKSGDTGASDANEAAPGGGAYSASK